MRKTVFAVISALALVVALLPATVAQAETWTGEVLDLACYVAKHAKGPDHAECAETCVKAGQPMGLLTADGEVFLLAASHEDGAPYEQLKDLAGQQAEVTGTVSERGGMKMITVTGSGEAM